MKCANKKSGTTMDLSPDQCPRAPGYQCPDTQHCKFNMYINEVLAGNNRMKYNKWSAKIKDAIHKKMMLLL